MFYIMNHIVSDVLVIYLEWKNEVEFTVIQYISHISGLQHGLNKKWLFEADAAL